MKRRVLLTAAGVIAAGGSGVGQTGQLPVSTADLPELADYEKAVARGSHQALQDFLVQYPDSALIGGALGQLIQTIPPHNAERIEQSERIWRVQYGGDDGDGGGGERSGAGNRGEPPRRQVQVTRQAAQRSIQLIERASRQFESDIDECDTRLAAARLNRCVGDALAVYSTNLSSPRIVLPPAAKPIPRIVAQAARQVRRAPTVKAARQVVQKAVAQVRKQIQVARVADDSVEVEVGTRAGEIVAASLDTVTSKLARVEL